MATTIAVPPHGYRGVDHDRVRVIFPHRVWVLIAEYVELWKDLDFDHNVFRAMYPGKFATKIVSVFRNYEPRQGVHEREYANQCVPMYLPFEDSHPKFVSAGIAVVQLTKEFYDGVPDEDEGLFAPLRKLMAKDRPDVKMRKLIHVLEVLCEECYQLVNSDLNSMAMRFQAEFELYLCYGELNRAVRLSREAQARHPKFSLSAGTLGNVPLDEDGEIRISPDFEKLRYGYIPFGGGDLRLKRFLDDINTEAMNAIRTVQDELERCEHAFRCDFYWARCAAFESVPDRAQRDPHVKPLLEAELAKRTMIKDVRMYKILGYLLGLIR
jgi:hypothetical protein